MGLTGKLMEVFLHPEEAVPLGKMYLAAKRAKKLPKSPTWAFCYDMLNRVSRSFAIVIQQLPEELRNAVCVFYLVLRGLDTVEDDMALNTKKKLRMLETFCDDIYDRTFVVKSGDVVLWPRARMAFLASAKNLMEFRPQESTMT